MSEKLIISKEILKQFFLDNEIISIDKLSNGNINDSYKIYTNNQNYLLQKINTDVFRIPIQVSKNIEEITCYLKKYFPEYTSVELKMTFEGLPFYKSKKDDFWRVLYWIEDSISYPFPETIFQAEQAGKTLAEFHLKLQNFPVNTLYETIPNFHNTKDRYQQFLKAIEKDIANRAKETNKEINFFIERKYLSIKIQNLLSSNQIPIRVTHNDPKMDNILLDKNSGKGICLIDLDTIMPGTILHDFGDMLRTCVVKTSENENKLDSIKIDIDLFKACVNGYVSIANQFITQKEKDNLYLGTLTIVFEQALRFLTDYLNGDQYYKIAYVDHNLERAKNQMKLLISLEQNQKFLEDIIQKSF